MEIRWQGGRSDGRTDGRRDGWTDGQTDAGKVLSLDLTGGGDDAKTGVSPMNGRFIYIAISKNSVKIALFRCVRISKRGLVRWSVGPSVSPSVGNAFVKINEKWSFTDSE